MLVFRFSPILSRPAGLLAWAFLLFCLTMNACVSRKKYQELEANYQKAKIAEDSRENQITLLQKENQRILGENETLRRENDELLTNSINRGNSENQETLLLRQRYDELVEAYDELRRNTTLESQYNRQKLQATQDQLYRGGDGPGNTGNNLSNPSNQTNYPTNNYNKDPQQNNTNPGVNTGNNPGLANKNQEEMAIFTADPNSVYIPASANIPALNALKADLDQGMQNYGEAVKTAVLNGKVYLGIADDLLFLPNTDQISPNGYQALGQASQVIKQRLPVFISLLSEPEKANGTSGGFLKAKGISEFLNQQGLNHSFQQKVFAPLAFETTGTGDKNPRSFIIISPNY